MLILFFWNTPFFLKKKNPQIIKKKNNEANFHAQNIVL